MRGGCGYLTVNNIIFTDLTTEFLLNCTLSCLTQLVSVCILVGRVGSVARVVRGQRRLSERGFQQNKSSATSQVPHWASCRKREREKERKREREKERKRERETSKRAKESKEEVRKERQKGGQKGREQREEVERERPPVLRFSTPPCVISKRLRVCQQNARILIHAEAC